MRAHTSASRLSARGPRSWARAQQGCGDPTCDDGHPDIRDVGEVALHRRAAIGGAAAVALTPASDGRVRRPPVGAARLRPPAAWSRSRLADAASPSHGDGYITVYGKFGWGIPTASPTSGGLQVARCSSEVQRLGPPRRLSGVRRPVRRRTGDRLLRGLRRLLESICVDDWKPGFGYYWATAFPTLYFDGWDISDSTWRPPPAGRRGPVHGRSPGPSNATEPAHLDLGHPGRRRAAEGDHHRSGRSHAHAAHGRQEVGRRARATSCSRTRARLDAGADRAAGGRPLDDHAATRLPRRSPRCWPPTVPPSRRCRSRSSVRAC